ncbi:MAG: pseudouridine synthase [Perlucidibaca sp.]
MHKKEPFTPISRPKSKQAGTTARARLVLLHKPFQVLCQFSPHEGKTTLSDVFASHQDGASKQFSGLYPAGRLDFDSEGLLLLTNHGPWQARVAHPRHKLRKTYWAQVEGLADDEALTRLCAGVVLNDGAARALSVRRLGAAAADIAPRDPPVRYRARIPTDWLEIVLDEGRNRQVRRMTAAVGLPTLRLVRWRIGGWEIGDLGLGEWREVR